MDWSLLILMCILLMMLFVVLRLVGGRGQQPKTSPPAERVSGTGPTGQKGVKNPTVEEGTRPRLETNVAP